MKITKKEILSIPNILSYFRIILIPVFAVIYLTAHSPAQHYAAIAILVLSGLTDMLDGKIARRFNMITELGKFMDPVADKLTMGVVFLCMTIQHPLFWLLVAIYVVKEGFLGIMGFITLKTRGRKLDGAMWYGKVCTAGTYLILFLLLIIPDMPKPVSDAMILICGADMVFTLIMYALKFKEMWALPPLKKNTKESGN